MKYVIQLFSMLGFSLLVVAATAQEVPEMNFNQLFKQMQAAGGSSERSGGGGTLSGGGSSQGAGGGGITVSIGMDWASNTSVLPRDYTLNWTAPGIGADSYVIQIAENKRGTIKEYVFVARVNGNSVTIPVGSLDLDPSKTYFVQIRSGDTHKSKKGLFNVVSNDYYDKVMQTVQTEKRFKEGTKLERTLMKAYALERANLIMDSYQQYNSYMKDANDDRTLRAMKENFVADHR